MRQLFVILFGSAMLTACDFKDNSGNAPLIEDENGYLIDNPAYVDPVKQDADEKRKEEVKELQTNMKAWADSAVAADKK